MRCAGSAPGSRARMVTPAGLYSLVAVLVVGVLGWHLRQPAAALPARRSGARQGAGGRGEPAARHQAHRRQSDRRADRVPARRSRSIRRRRSRPSPRCMPSVETQAGVGNVWSLETLRRWLAREGRQHRRRDAEGVRRSPARCTWCAASSRPTRTRWWCRAAFPTTTPAQLLPVVNRPRPEPRRGPRRRIPATRSRSPASPSIAARNSAGMIDKLNRGLTVEIVFVAAFIGLAFRSLVVMLAAILPGIFPVLVSRQRAVGARATACSSRASSRSPCRSASA